MGIGDFFTLSATGIKSEFGIISKGDNKLARLKRLYGWSLSEDDVKELAEELKKNGLELDYKDIILLLAMRGRLAKILVYSMDIGKSARKFFQDVRRELRDSVAASRSKNTDFIITKELEKLKLTRRTSYFLKSILYDSKACVGLLPKIIEDEKREIEIRLSTQIERDNIAEMRPKYEKYITPKKRKIKIKNT